MQRNQKLDRPGLPIAIVSSHDLQIVVRGRGLGSGQLRNNNPKERR